ncbi:MAG: o-succinylbenzoate synthase [Chloroflexi bacterium]|nr:o-succinylbenzoate synthase [Chloroflexota bacterium]
MPLTIQSLDVYPIALTYVEPLKTSFGDQTLKAAVVVRLCTTNGLCGWGEASVELSPGYGSETVGTALHVIRNFIAPLLLGETFEDPFAVSAAMGAIRGHHHTRAGVEAAAWDAFAQLHGLSLAHTFATFLPEGHAPRPTAQVGVSIGMKPTIEATLEIIRKRVNEGYGRIKLKIAPGWDVELARAVRAEFPDILLMLDANSAYTLRDTDHLARLDEFDLLMIEQPLGHDDIYQHSKLQPKLKTRICLDESIKSADDLHLALEIGAIRILNLKPARVGGYCESLNIYRVCAEHQLPLWIGGMMETGIGRAANLALASLPAVTLPCDISATDRYYVEDLTEPPFRLNAGSTIDVPTGVGIGVAVQMDRIERAVAAWEEMHAYV